VRAVAAGETEIAITPQAIVAARLASVAPEAVALAMSMVNRLLPKAASADAEMRPATEVRAKGTMPAASIGDANAHRYNQSA
jgi:hypothetical protein